LDLDAFGGTAVYRLLANVLVFRGHFVNNNFGDVTIHFEHFRAEIDADLITRAEVFIY
jgi:hypothetical protein